MGKNEMNVNIGSAVLIFLSGVGTGIALAGLLTPRSGAATRRLIGRKVEDTASFMKHKSDAAQDYLWRQGEELRDRVKDVAEDRGKSVL